MKAAAGIVLPTVIGVLVLVELLAVAILTVALQEITVSRERAAAVQLQLAARSTTAQLSSGPVPAIQALAPGGRLPLPLPADTSAAVASAEIQRVSPGLFLLRTTAQSGLGASWSRTTVGTLLNGFDSQTVLNRLPGALNVGTSAHLEGAASVDGSSTSDPAFACPSWLTYPDSAAGIAHGSAAAIAVDNAARVVGAPPFLELAVAADSAGLGGFGLEVLTSWADRQQSGTVDLMPEISATLCSTTTPNNWGAPLDALHPCANFFPLIRSAGDLVIASGAGQGTLIVDGNLLLEGGTTFLGLVIVAGTLTLNPGARIEGAARARAAVLHAGAVRRSNCALSNALTRASALNRLMPRRGRRWIPVS
jgi:hypothetical protein